MVDKGRLVLKPYITHLYQNFFKQQGLQVFSIIVDSRLLSYFLTGAVNTVFAYVVFSLLTFLGLGYPLASLFSTVVGVFFNFKTIGTWVFKNCNPTLLGRFVCVYTVVYAANLVGLRTLLVFGLSSYAAAAVLAVPIGLLGFFLDKKFVFG